MIEFIVSYWPILAIFLAAIGGILFNTKVDKPKNHGKNGTVKKTPSEEVHENEKPLINRPTILGYLMISIASVSLAVGILKQSRDVLKSRNREEQLTNNLDSLKKSGIKLIRSTDSLTNLTQGINAGQISIIQKVDSNSKNVIDGFTKNIHTIEYLIAESKKLDLKIEADQKMTAKLDGQNKIAFLANISRDSITPLFVLKIKTNFLFPYADTSLFKKSLDEKTAFREYLKSKKADAGEGVSTDMFQFVPSGIRKGIFPNSEMIFPKSDRKEFVIGEVNLSINRVLENVIWFFNTGEVSCISFNREKTNLPERTHFEVSDWSNNELTLTIQYDKTINVGYILKNLLKGEEIVRLTTYFSNDIEMSAIEGRMVEMTKNIEDFQIVLPYRTSSGLYFDLDLLRKEFSVSRGDSITEGSITWHISNSPEIVRQDIP